MPKLPKVIAITGTIGSGKSTVRRILEQKIPVLDCDALARDLVEPGQAGWNELKKIDRSFFDEDVLNRQRMADRMFSDPVIRKNVNAVLHPLIIQEMKNWMESQEGICAVEVPLLFELSLEDLFDETWLIVVDEKLGLERLTKRGMKREDAKARLEAQMPVEEKKKRTDVIIKNNDNEIALEEEVWKVFEKFKEKAGDGWSEVSD